ncbi:hypothetical protein HMPREF1870_02918 [Bacteroidales bacterium KA00344]|nr:hypothetical protein HMPREF1870_02918 [Bacteroidales bacterium KA00344]
MHFSLQTPPNAAIIQKNLCSRPKFAKICAIRSLLIIKALYKYAFA